LAELNGDREHKAGQNQYPKSKSNSSLVDSPSTEANFFCRIIKSYRCVYIAEITGKFASV